MLIGALCGYSDILAKTGRLTPEGWTSQDVNRIILLNPDGSIAQIEETSKAVLLPYRDQTTKIFAYRLEHRPEYIFGLAWDKEKSCISTSVKKNGKIKSLIPNHDEFVKRNLEFIEGMTSPTIDAFRNFLLTWNPEEHLNDSYLSDNEKLLSGKFCFQLNGMEYDILGKDEPLIEERVNEQMTEAASDEGVKGTCAITGETNSVIAKTHPVIKGLQDSNNNRAVLICFNNPSDESYNAKQSYNSSISEKAAKKYSEALNFLLDKKGNNHCSVFDDMTVVYWAMSPNADTDNNTCALFRLTATGTSDKVDNALLDVMAKARAGTASEALKEIDINPDVDFYIAGLVPNVSRISVKFCCRSTAADILNNIVKHQEDLALDDNSKQIGINRILNALYPCRDDDKAKKSDSDKTKKKYNPLYSSLFESVINGTKYPDGLLWEVVRRCKTDSIKTNDRFGVYSVRVSIIKACLNRAARLANKEEKITMALNKENTSPAYVCGRIFAILEYAQKSAASTEINRTIKDAYFTSAATRPSAVLPRLTMLAQHHLEKAENGGRVNKQLQEAIDRLDNTFPKTLSLEQQGEFIIGYYQQNKALYTSNKKADAE